MMRNLKINNKRENLKEEYKKIERIRIKTL